MKTISKPLAERLKKLGMNVPSYFCYSRNIRGEYDSVIFENRFPLEEDEYYNYSLDELWGVLPDYIEIDNKTYFKNLGDCDMFSYDDHENKHVLMQYNGANCTVTEAAGLMLEWIIQNKYVTVEEVNGES
jgi:hypothetical protein